MKCHTRCSYFIIMILFGEPVRFFDLSVYVFMHWTIIAYSWFRTTLPHNFLNLVLVSALRDYLLKSFFSFRYCFIFFFNFMCLYAIWKFSYKKILKYFGHAACNVHCAFQIENIRWTAWIYYWIVFLHLFVHSQLMYEIKCTQCNSLNRDFSKTKINRKSFGEWLFIIHAFIHDPINRVPVMKF